MRIRSVKPEWLEDERLLAAGSEARMFSVALMLLADDHGRGRASEVILAGRVYPGDPESLAKVRESLARLSGWFVKLYEVRGQRYFSILNWKKHQKVDKPGKPLCPGPEEAESPQEAALSRDPRETLAKAPETLAPETDLETETEGRGTREARGPRPSLPCAEPDAIAGARPAWVVLWDIWVDVALHGVPSGSPPSGKLQAAWASCAAQDEGPAELVFERAATAYVEDTRARGKRVVLRFFLDDLGEWFAAGPARPKGGTNSLPFLTEDEAPVHDGVDPEDEP
jgi:hypothetical protein